MKLLLAFSGFFVPVSFKPRDPGIHRLLQCIGLPADFKSQIIPLVPLVSVAALPAWLLLLIWTELSW